MKKKLGAALIGLSLLAAGASADSSANAPSELQVAESVGAIKGMRETFAAKDPAPGAGGAAGAVKSAKDLFLDDLYKQEEEAWHHGQYWETRRLFFKIVDVSPDDITGLATLA